MTNIDFIKFLVPYAQLTQKKYGVYASVTIAQAIIESAWGNYKGTVVTKDNNYFGIKFYGNHCPDIIVTKGSYATDDGGYYAHYLKVSDSILDHGYFLRNNSRYPKGGVFDKNITADEQIHRIMMCGYAGSIYEVQAISIMQTYNLYQYDNVSRETLNVEQNVSRETLNNKPKDEYKNLQMILNDEYCTNLKVDGIIGQATLKALPTLKYGNRNRLVKWLQSYIVNYYQINLTIDGIFGTQTKTAIMSIQKLRKIHIDGIVGLNTWKGLLK